MICCPAGCVVCCQGHSELLHLQLPCSGRHTVPWQTPAAAGQLEATHAVRLHHICVCAGGARCGESAPSDMVTNGWDQATWHVLRLIYTTATRLPVGMLNTFHVHTVHTLHVAQDWSVVSGGLTAGAALKGAIRGLVKWQVALLLLLCSKQEMQSF